jgi:hypothetical protein
MLLDLLQTRYLAQLIEGSLQCVANGTGRFSNRFKHRGQQLLTIALGGFRVPHAPVLATAGERLASSLCVGAHAIRAGHCAGVATNWVAGVNVCSNNRRAPFSHMMVYYYFTVKVI